MQVTAMKVKFINLRLIVVIKMVFICGYTHKVILILRFETKNGILMKKYFLGRKVNGQIVFHLFLVCYYLYFFILNLNFDYRKLHAKSIWLLCFDIKVLVFVPKNTDLYEIFISRLLFF
jgi:hypothetical protein